MMGQPLKLTFSNARARAEFEDWPSGRDRVRCRFYTEHDARKGRRVCRQTTDRNGQWCKPKATVYGGMCAIVDGSDGKTYVLQLAHPYGFVKVLRHDFMDATQEAGAGAVFPNDPDFAALVALVGSVGLISAD